MENGQCGTSFGIPEVKMLLLLSYFIIAGVVALISFAIDIENTDLFLEELINYFNCHLGGDDLTCEEFRQRFEDYNNTKLGNISILLMSLITWVNLLFAIHTQDVKWIIQKMKSFCDGKRRESHTQQTIVS